MQRLLRPRKPSRVWRDSAVSSPIRGMQCRLMNDSHRAPEEQMEPGRRPPRVWRSHLLAMRRPHGEINTLDGSVTQVTGGMMLPSQRIDELCEYCELEDRFLKQLNETMERRQNEFAEDMDKLREDFEMRRSPIHKQMQEDNFDEATVAPLLRWLTSHSAAWAMGRMATAVVSSEKSRAARASCRAAAPTEGEPTVGEPTVGEDGRLMRRAWPLDAASPPRARMAANTAASRQRQTAALSR